VQIACPACRKLHLALDGPDATCTRCGCELGSLVAIAAAAVARLQDACDALRAGQAGLALGHADRSWRLRRSRHAAAAAALAAACCGDAIALERWRRRWADGG
jgi:hypothetical protein